MDKPNNRYDIIIANPPYGKIGNEITKAVIDNIDYGVFVNLLPANDYRRFHKEDALWQYVDINSMQSIGRGLFKDAYVTTMMCKVNKNRARYIGEDEFEIECYIDNSLKKYFYETRNRNHYAIDNYISNPKFERFENISIEKSIYIGHRDPNRRHLPYTPDSITNRYNRNQVTKEQVIEESAPSRQALGIVGDFYLINFNTELEKTNISNFMYSKDGFRFISKLMVAMNVDSGANLNKFMPKVSWQKPQTVESILRDYGYTPSEIEEVVADLANFKGME